MSTPATIPAAIRTIGLCQMISGAINIAATVFFFGFGFLQGLVTLGAGFAFCVPGLLFLPLAIVELRTGRAHLAGAVDTRRPIGLALVQCVGIAGCNPVSLGIGLWTLSILRDPAVAAWYRESAQAEGSGQ